MARKKKHPEHVNHERWLVSYADFVTLLFAFFVVMFAVSQVDTKKLGHFSESFSKASGIDIFPLAGQGVMPGATEGPPSADGETKASVLPDELSGLKTDLTTAARHEAALQNVQVLVRRNELVLRLADSVLFDSGNDTVRDPAIRVLARIASDLKKRDIEIRVEGHTDDRPIRNSRFDSNWSLSTGRATAVVSKLAAEGIAGPRLSAAGFGEFHPLVPNTTEKGKQQNRRVDLVVSVPVKEPRTNEPPSANEPSLAEPPAKDPPSGNEHAAPKDHPPGNEHAAPKDHPPGNEHPPSKDHPPGNEHPPSKDHPPGNEHPPSKGHPPGNEHATSKDHPP
jgi:chemotaxis protein MotB